MSAIKGKVRASLQERYQSDILPALQETLGLKNPWAVPRFEKVVVHVGIGKIRENAGLVEFIKKNLEAITGQKPFSTLARQSIATFKIRQGMPAGLKVTLRGRRMFDFLEKLITFALPRVRDFQGLPGDKFDGRGNYTFGLAEHIVFPEGIYETPDKIFSLAITIQTTAKKDQEARKLLEAIGFPFKKESG